MCFFRKIVIILFCVLIIFSPSWSAPSSNILTKEDYLYDSIFKVETGDLMGQGYNQLVVLGRDYTDHLISVQVLKWSEGDLTSVWESPNLLKEGLPVMTTGKPLPTGEEAIIIFTGKCLYLYTYENEKITLASQIYHSLSPYELSAADLDGDGIDELLVVRLGKRMDKYDEKVVDVYRLQDEELFKISTSPLLGNIRSITGGDLDGDGCAEVITESGLSSRAGTINLLRWDQEKEQLVPEFKRERLLPAVVFGMQVGTFGEGPILYTADGWGRLNFFALAEKNFTSIRKELPFPKGLVTVATGDFNGDGEQEVAVVGHPNNLHIFSLEAK